MALYTAPVQVAGGTNDRKLLSLKMTESFDVSGASQVLGTMTWTTPKLVERVVVSGQRGTILAGETTCTAFYEFLIDPDSAAVATAWQPFAGAVKNSVAGMITADVGFILDTNMDAAGWCHVATFSLNTGAQNVVPVVCFGCRVRYVLAGTPTGTITHMWMHVVTL